MKIKIISALLACSCLLAACSQSGNESSEGRVPTGDRVPVSGSDSGADTGSETVSSEDISSVLSQCSSHSSKSSSTTGKPPAASSGGISSVNTNYKVLKTVSAGKSATSGRLVHEVSGIDLAAKQCGLVRVTVKNTSQASRLTIQFTTNTDDNYLSAKGTDVDIVTSGDSKTYIADISNKYGFNNNLKRLKITSNTVYDGTLTIEKVEFLAGGSRLAPFTVGPKNIVATRDQLRGMSKHPTGETYFPDGIMGILENSDGSFDFISSNPINTMKSVTITNGDRNNPAKKLVLEGGGVINTPEGRGPDEFNYVSTGQVYRFEGTECITILHLERHFNANGDFDPDTRERAEGNLLMAPSLALGYSPDNGRTWYYCGEIARQNCESIDPYFGIGEAMPDDINGGKSVGRDIGNGAFIIKDGYIYVYMIEVDTRYSQTMGVMRAKLSDVIAAARAKKTAKNTNLFKKYYNGKFNEPAFGGKATGVIDDECAPNFCTIVYSTYLKKYIMARCVSPQYNTNDGDMAINISSDPLNFKGNTYYVDTDVDFQQYPTLMGDGKDPAFTTGKKVYLYYVDAKSNDTFLWHKANVVRREITFD